MKTSSLKNLTKTLIIATLLFVGVGTAFGVWNSPPGPPPTNGINDATIPTLNVGPEHQTKQGDITASSLMALGDVSGQNLIAFDNAMLGGAGTITEIGGAYSGPGTPHAFLEVHGSVEVTEIAEATGTITASSLENIFQDLKEATLCATDQGEIELCSGGSLMVNLVASKEGIIRAWDFEPVQMTWIATANIPGTISCSYSVNGNSPQNQESQQSSWFGTEQVNSGQWNGPDDVYTHLTMWYPGQTGQVSYYLTCVLWDQGGNNIDTAQEIITISYDKPEINTFLTNGANYTLTDASNYGSESNYDDISRWQKWHDPTGPNNDQFYDMPLGDSVPLDQDNGNNFFLNHACSYCYSGEETRIRLIMDGFEKRGYSSF
ncbi:MAG: hypothetical protein ACI83D_000529 [Planctomycetota bacterium]|jgi:hypothetical protein